ncbi:MAG: hypothetical protein KAJ86_04365 [Alphaproteobacteria bacterium]|nr:hypothetical protein [Alphaproteobacteria bacterium]
MKIIKFTSLLVLALIVCGFGYFAFTDIPIRQYEVSKEIPYEHLRD